uniref:Dienelactone hydrolase domain-containing protein n=1 Tax=Peronospora matthiolae TaxID=2874970 RepID=A0AAV1UGR6_9STRA
MSSSSVVRPRFVHPGAGSTLQFPLDNSSVSTASSLSPDGRLQDAYFVAPASHIGRIVTGVVLLAEKSRVSRAVAPDEGAADCFGLTVVSFADKLAEQGYKVLVLDLFAPEWKTIPTASATLEHVAIVHQAAVYLKKKHDIQRVGICGVGAGADVAIQMAMERSVPVDCVVAMCPKGLVPWTCPESGGDCADTSEVAVIPMLLQVGGKSPYAASEAYQTLLSSRAASPQAATALKTSLFVNQRSGFAFSSIKDEDAATQAIAEVLDWFVQHLHRFKVAAATSDTDPWWPQGRNGPFCNVGLRTWQESRAIWLTPTQTRPPRPPPVPAHLLFDGLSSVRRTFELPQRMRLGDVIELFAEIWDVQQ